MGLLGSVLVRLIAAVPPDIVLPPIIGGHASLNLFTAVVDHSGGGKGGAEAAAEKAIDLPETPTFGPGSGEGLAHLFMSRSRGRDPEQHTAAVILSAAEIDTLAALKNRQASTLFPELRKAWMGEPLGFAYVDPAKRLIVPRHSYRLCRWWEFNPPTRPFCLTTGPLEPRNGSCGCPAMIPTHPTRQPTSRRRGTTRYGCPAERLGTTTITVSTASNGCMPDRTQRDHHGPTATAARRSVR